MSRWKTECLGDLCDIAIGRTPARAEPRYWQGGTLPWLSIGDMTQGRDLVRTRERITEAAVAECGGKLIPAGTLVMSFKLSVGKLGFLRVPMFTNEAIAALPIRKGKEVDPGFLYRALQVARLSDSADRAVKGLTLNTEKLARVQIAYPEDVAEQRRIANILDKADAVRRKRQKAFEHTEALMRSTFLDLFGDPVTNPRAWSVEPLGTYLSFVTSGSRGWAEHYTDRGERFIRSLDVQMDHISDNEPAFVDPPSGAEAERTRVREDDVLLTITGSKIGRVARATAAHAGAYVSQHVAILRLKPGLDPDVATAFLVNDRGGQVLIARTQYGQTKPGLNLAQIRSFPIPVPPEPVQARIRAARTRVRSLRERLTGALQSSDELFSSLVQRAFDGAVSR